MGERPSGTVTFLFTDIEGSTRLWEESPDEMRAALAEHDGLLRAAFEAHEGSVFATGGDGFAVVFGRARDAVAAAAEAQASLADHPIIKVRMGVHTGEAEERDGDYFGPAVNRAARLMGVAHGAQVLVSSATEEVVGSNVELVDLGEHRLRDLSRPVRVFQLGGGTFGPLATLDASRTNLPVQLTELVGRESELDDLCGLVAAHPLVTIVGVGGVGRTRLSLQCAAALAHGYDDGAWFVDLSGVSDPSDVALAVAGVLEVRPRAGLSVALSIIELLRHREMLLVIDNCEHVLDAVRALLEPLVTGSPRVHVIATSRESLGVRGERAVALGALATPRVDGGSALEDLAGVESVALFCMRAATASPGFRLHDGNGPAVAELCRRLEGIPLALELAAARMRMMTPRDALDRLDRRFRLLGSSARSSPGRGSARGRHDTLRAAIEWSHALLPSAEQTVLHRLSVFAGGFTLDDAEHVCGDDEIDTWDVVDIVGRLVDKSLVVTDHSADVANFRLLEMIREFAAEQLDAAETRDVRERHSGWMIELAEQIDQGLQGPDEALWLRRVSSETENLRTAAVWLVSLGDTTRLRRLGTAVMGAGFVVPTTGLAEIASLAWRVSCERSDPPDPAGASLAAAAAVVRGRSDLVDSILGDGDASVSVTSWGWWAKSLMLMAHGDFARAIDDLRRASAAPGVEHRSLRTFLLSAVSTVASVLGELSEARGASAEALVLAAELNSPTAWAYGRRGRAARGGRRRCDHDSGRCQHLREPRSVHHASRG